MSDKQELPEKPAKQQTDADIRELLSSNAYSAFEGIQEGIEAALKGILPQVEAATEIANKAAATVLNELTEGLSKIKMSETPNFQKIYRVIDEITTEWNKTVDFYNNADKEKILEHWNSLDEDQREYILELLSSLKEYGDRPEEAAAAYDKLASIVNLEQRKGKDEVGENGKVVLTITETTNKMILMADKVNSVMWNRTEEETGKLLHIKAEKHGDDKPIDILHSINFDKLEEEGLTITKKLDAYDKRVYEAISTLYTYNGDVMTLGQIYHTMGYNGKIGQSDKRRLNESIAKMQMAILYISNEAEAKRYNYPLFVYNSNLLPLERITAVVNGKIVADAIHLFREPPSFTFAKERKQIATIKRSMLTTPLNKNSANLQLEEYIVLRIKRAERTQKKKETILFKTIFENVGITETKSKQRAKKKIIDLLEYYKSDNDIKEYSISKEKILIFIKTD